jgi:3-deoxy-D-manno-octulosonate 8-phosphate phosphatase KdsC-like HAD superfamily phosphatase
LGDLPLIESVGFAACPKNAVESIKPKCHYVSSHFGGAGFVREICDMIMESKQVGKHDQDKNQE